MRESSYDGSIGEEVAIKVARFNIEDINENSNVGENMGSLLREIVFHEGILSRKVKGKLVCQKNSPKVKLNTRLPSQRA